MCKIPKRGEYFISNESDLHHWFKFSLNEEFKIGSVSCWIFPLITFIQAIQDITMNFIAMFCKFGLWCINKKRVK